MGEVPLYQSTIMRFVPLAVVRLSTSDMPIESGPLVAVHLSRHKWPGGSVN